MKENKGCGKAISETENCLDSCPSCSNNSLLILQDKEPDSVNTWCKDKSGSDFKLSDKSWFIGHEQHNYIDRGKGEVLGIEDVKEFILRLKEDFRVGDLQKKKYSYEDIRDKIDKLSGDFK